MKNLWSTACSVGGCLSSQPGAYFKRKKAVSSCIYTITQIIQLRCTLSSYRYRPATSSLWAAQKTPPMESPFIYTTAPKIINLFVSILMYVSMSSVCARWAAYTMPNRTANTAGRNRRPQMHWNSIVQVDNGVYFFRRMTAVWPSHSSQSSANPWLQGSAAL